MERESEMLGEMAGEQMRISVCESADSDLLLIHGEPMGERQFGSSEAPIARRCFITVGSHAHHVYLPR
jgi:hypothetical protein